MERAAWTEERLDDLAEGTRAGFARIDQDLRDLRAEMHQGFSDLRTEMHQGSSELRAEMHGGFAEMRVAIQRLNLALVVGLIGVIATILGVFATFLARGA
jgi:hypothetical protein